MEAWSFEPFGGYLSALAVAGILLGLLAIGPNSKKLTRRQKSVLLLARVAAILLVLLLLFRPVHVNTRANRRNSDVLILADTSRSMQLAETGGRSRYDAMVAALRDSKAALEAVSANSRLRFFGFDSASKELAERDEALYSALKPAGDQTDYGAALSAALDSENGKRIAAIILIGDGTQTALGSTSDSQSAARRLRDDFAAPLYSVALGPTSDASSSKDIALERLDEQFNVFVKSEFPIRAWIKSVGYANQTVPVELSLTDDMNRKTVLTSLKVRLSADGSLTPIELTHVPEKPGNFKLTLKVLGQPGELITTNNELTAYLTVLDGGLRVLFVDSGKRIEHKFVKRALNDSPDIAVDDFVVDFSQSERWPLASDELFESTRYDVFVVANTPYEAFSAKGWRSLALAIEKGKGVYFLGGPRSFGAGNFAGTPIADLMPIEFNRFERQDLRAADREDLFVSTKQKLTPTKPHPIIKLMPEPDNERAWNDLPPLDYANRLVGVKDAPGVQVLLEGARQTPILVTGQYGKGRVLAFAGDSTFRWVMHGNIREHRRFWRQGILWLAGRDQLERDKTWIRMDSRRLFKGMTAQFETGVNDQDGAPVPSPKISAKLQEPTGSTSELRIGYSGSTLGGAIRPTVPGEYTIEVTAQVGGKNLPPERMSFLVLDNDLELSFASADHEHLRRLSNVTTEQGGKMVTPEELPNVIREIASRPPEMETRQIKWRLADSPVEAWIVLLALVTVLTIEWWLRKTWGLE